MSLNYMTGYGRAEGVSGPYSWRWDVRAVNAKGLDMRIRLPQGWEPLEGPAREAVRKTAARGAIQVNLTVQASSEAASSALNHQALNQLLEDALPYLSDGKVAPPSLDGLLRTPGFSGQAAADDDPEAWTPAVLDGLGEAVADMAAARRKEGEGLETALRDLGDHVETLAKRAGDRAAAQPEAIKTRIETAFQELLSETELDPARLAMETAALVVKADVREELQRLDSHIAAYRDLLDQGSPCGRKLEFLTQEMHREANTLCSKSADIALTESGLALKAAIDQIKEQAANAE